MTATSNRPLCRLAALQPYLYLLPALVAIVLFVYLPLARTVQLSFYETNLAGTRRLFVNFGNYERLLADPLTLRILWQSALTLALAVLGSCIVPIGLAFLALQLNEREVDFFQTMLFLPVIIAASVAVLIWVWFYLPVNNGLFNTLLRGLGGTQAVNWLNDARTALPAVSLVANWKIMGFHFLIALAGLKAIPREFLEAAYVDGAAGWPLVRRIVLPLFAPTGLFILIVTLIQGMEHMFVPVEVMTQGGPASATLNIFYAVYQEGFKFSRVGMASALSVILIALFGGLIYAQYRLLDRRVVYDR